MQVLSSAAAVVILALSTVGCGGSPGPDDPYASAASGLCDASARAEMGELDMARQAFYDTAHQPLHDLAAEVAEVDRGLAARLLEAKESVESGLESDGSDLAASFHTLVVAADEALRATDHNPMPCPIERL